MNYLRPNFLTSFYFLLVFILLSCSSKTNQYVVLADKNRLRNGKWIEKEISNREELVSKGNYKLGKKIGVWKTFKGKQLYQKEKIKKNISKTKTYFPNGKLMESGQTRTDVTENEIHWYYFGDWKYYDSTGKLILVKRYNNGKVDTIEINPKKITNK